MSLLLHVISEENLNHIISDFLQVKQNFIFQMFLSSECVLEKLNDLIYLLALTENWLMYVCMDHTCLKAIIIFKKVLM